jgi:hypothetical protein
MNEEFNNPLFFKEQDTPLDDDDAGSRTYIVAVKRQHCGYGKFCIVEDETENCLHFIA